MIHRFLLKIYAVIDQIAHINRNSLGGDCRQLIAVFVALQYYRLQIPIDYCLLFIGLSIIANLLATYLYPENNDYPKQKTCCLLYSICSTLGFDLSYWWFE